MTTVQPGFIGGLGCRCAEVTKFSAKLILNLDLPVLPLEWRRRLRRRLLAPVFICTSPTVVRRFRSAVPSTFGVDSKAATGQRTVGGVQS